MPLDDEQVRRRARTAAHKDANHDKLVRAWRAMGGTWQDTYQLGGALDGIAGIYGIDQRVEIKNRDGVRGTPSSLRLTHDEQATFDMWVGRPPVVWTTIEDVEHTRQRLLQEHLGKRGKPSSIALSIPSQ